jgi:hypothetical protein
MFVKTGEVSACPSDEVRIVKIAEALFAPRIT